MKQTIRILSAAIFLLVVFFTAFLVSVVYSAARFKMNFNSPIFSLENRVLKISMPFEVDNSGIHEIRDLNILTLIFMNDDVKIAEAKTQMPLVAHGQILVVYHHISMNLDSLLLERSNLLFNDTDLILKYFVSLNFGSVVPFNLVGQGSLFWGAPLYNFSIGAINLSDDRERVLVPMSFENHSNFFNVTGVLRIELYNEYGEFLGEGVTNLDVSMKSMYNSIVEFFLDSTRFTGRGELHIYFATSVFDYGIWRISYGD